MIALALDLATCTGCAMGALGAAAPSFWTWDLFEGGSHRHDQWANLARRLCDHLRDNYVTDVVVEKPMPLMAAARSGTNEAAQDMLRGCIGVAQAVTSMAGIKAQWMIDPKDARQTLIGRRTFPKGTAKGHVIKACHWRGWRVRTSDEADACALWNCWCVLRTPRLGGLLDPGLRPEAGQR